MLRKIDEADEVVVFTDPEAWFEANGVTFSSGFVQMLADRPVLSDPKLERALWLDFEDLHA